MSQSYGEQLRAKAIAVNEHNARLTAEASALDITESGLTATQEEILASGFVEENLGLAISKVIAEADNEADHGRFSSRTTWGFNAEYNDPELPLKLLKYRALRARTVAHFEGMGVVASEIDTRSGYPWHNDDPDSEVTLEWRPSSYRLIGVELSWGEEVAVDTRFDPLVPSVLREHLGADEWLGQGQASPL